MNVLERIWFYHNFCPFAKRVRHRTLTPVYVGSNPTGAVIKIGKEIIMGNQNTCCGTCCWHEYYNSDWICTNEYSENENQITDYNDNCPDWEER